MLADREAVRIEVLRRNAQNTFKQEVKAEARKRLERRVMVEVKRRLDLAKQLAEERGWSWMHVVGEVDSNNDPRTAEALASSPLLSQCKDARCDKKSTHVWVADVAEYMALLNETEQALQDAGDPPVLGKACWSPSSLGEEYAKKFKKLTSRLSKGQNVERAIMKLCHVKQIPPSCATGYRFTGQGAQAPAPQMGYSTLLRLPKARSEYVG